jgi:uncharacterized membrane protein YcfT
MDAGKDLRVEWIDHAKGLCIFAVVTMYATHHVQQSMQTVGWMQAVVNFAQPFRMPDFFLLAGLFVPRVLKRGWLDYFNSKALYFIYFYAVWVTFRFIVTDVRHIPDTGVGVFLLNYLRLYLEPPSGPLWFIYLLAWFFIAVRLVRRLPAIIVLLAAAALQMSHLDTDYTMLDKFAHYFVFFYSGFVFSDSIFEFAGWAKRHWIWAIAILVAWFAGNTLLVETNWADVRGVNLGLGYAGALAVLLLATLLEKMSGFRWLGYLGRHSLFIYLGFVIPLGVVRWLMMSVPNPLDSGTLSLIATVASVAGALALYWALRHTPLKILYERPEWASLGAKKVIEPVPAPLH